MTTRLEEATVAIVALGVAWGFAACSSGDASTSAGTGGAGGATSVVGPTSAPSSTTGTGGTTSVTTTTSSSGTGGVMGKRPFPDTSAIIGILADQLPPLTPQQQQFVVDHYVGTEKLTLDQSMPLRALKPDFLVLHYHLAIWQSAPGVDFILDGKSWGNDFPTVDKNETWFWHNTSNSRIQSVNDGKYLMQIGDSGFAQYWQTSFLQQVQAGDYDGVFADSASPALLNFEAQMPAEPRLQGTGVRDNPIPELGGKTYIQAWEAFMTSLNDFLGKQGIPLIPNTGAFITSWDNTKYDLTAGVFSEGFADPGFATSDWKASTNELLLLASENKIMILQNYLGSTSDLAKRRYYLGNYLLVKGTRTYLDYFANGPLEWYPEWGIDLGAATKTGKTVDDLVTPEGIYRRDFQKGVVLVNPTGAPAMVQLGGTFNRVEPQGGGPVDPSGATPGTIGTTPMTSISVPASSAEILLK